MMILFHDDRAKNLAEDFAEYLSSILPCETPVALCVVPDEYEAVCYDEAMGYGAYYYDGQARMTVISLPAWRRILQDEDPEATSLDALREFWKTIAHEYLHHVQHMSGQGCSQDDAEERAASIVRAFMEGRHLPVL